MRKRRRGQVVRVAWSTRTASWWKAAARVEPTSARRLHQLLDPLGRETDVVAVDLAGRLVGVEVGEVRRPGGSQLLGDRVEVDADPASTVGLGGHPSLDGVGRAPERLAHRGLDDLLLARRDDVERRLRAAESPGEVLQAEHQEALRVEERDQLVEQRLAARVVAGSDARRTDHTPTLPRPSTQDASSVPSMRADGTTARPRERICAGVTGRPAARVLTWTARGTGSC